MKSLLKWPGGKERELAEIFRYMPDYSGRYIEPFVGGGAVYFAQNNHKCLINDKSRELINLYTCVKNQDPDFINQLWKFQQEFSSLGNFAENYSQDLLVLYQGDLDPDAFIRKHDEVFLPMADLNSPVFISELRRNLTSKIKRTRKLEIIQGELSPQDRITNLEGALKSSYYMYIRHLLNNPEPLSPGKQASVFFFIREFCYSSMFRYSSRGKFNVPYGGISYNRKDFARKISELLGKDTAQRLNSTQICNLDFEDFLKKINPAEDDFIFLDPPYDSEFSTYAENTFDRQEQIRLFNYLKKTPARIMLVIKNTDFIYDLYHQDFNIQSFDKTYAVSFKNRNQRNVKHLLITNYETKCHI